MNIWTAYIKRFAKLTMEVSPTDLKAKLANLAAYQADKAAEAAALAKAKAEQAELDRTNAEKKKAAEAARQQAEAVRVTNLEAAAKAAAVATNAAKKQEEKATKEANQAADRAEKERILEVLKAAGYVFHNRYPGRLLWKLDDNGEPVLDEYGEAVENDAPNPCDTDLLYYAPFEEFKRKWAELKLPKDQCIKVWMDRYPHFVPRMCGSQ